jgi:predicted benzoate:H+ symporter BenE
MPSAVDVAGDILTATTALAGLILVFLGATAASFEAFEKREQASVRSRFQARAWQAFYGFVLALVAATLAILGKWLNLDWAAGVAMICFVVGLGVTLLAALNSVREIK